MDIFLLLPTMYFPAKMALVVLSLTDAHRSLLENP